MAVPATTTRVTPAGLKLDDGFSTLMAFAADPNISFWELTVQPPILDGGDPIDFSNMHNVLYHTMAPRSLLTVGPANFTAFYDPDVWDEARDIMNNRGAITIQYPDGSTLDFFGFLRSIEKQPLEEGAAPTMNGVVVVTNWDPANNVEQGPVMTEVSGT